MNPSPGKQRILIVDDDRDMVTLLAAAIRAAGFEVIPAEDAMQGLRIAMRERPALIVADLQMPAGGGRGLLERLAVPEQTRNVPILVVTGTIDPSREQEVLAAGARKVLFKPVDPAQVVAAIREMLGQRES
ncbi:MAG TPA: response regulator [Streptosporangiaceae bacterium]|nr:response regulator [Streptosporangiaceae bacterium]